MMKFTLYVIPRTKKNSSQMVLFKGKPRLIPSKYYRQFENECIMQISNDLKKQINTPINVKAIFYMPTKRRVDLTNLLSALDDMLVKANVVIDDNRDVIAQHDGSMVLYDKQQPRIEIEIKKLEGYEQWKKN